MRTKHMLSCIVLLVIGAAAYSQSRDNIRIYVRPVIGGTAEEKAYFHDNFTQEIMGANYPVVQSEKEANYVLKLECIRGEHETGAYKSIQITIIDVSDGHEVVTYSCEYETLSEMNDWNLYLIYQGLANVPAPGIIYIDRTEYDTALQKWEDRRWRNKWIYAALYGGTGFGYGFEANETDTQVNLQWYRPDLFTIGLSGEVQFLYWMSVEVGLEFRGSRVKGDFFPGIDIPVLLKFPLKPLVHFMISPYAGVQFNINIYKNSSIVPVDFLAGAQFAVKAGSRGGFFLNVQYNIDLGTPPSELYYYKNSIELAIGYKIGWRDRIAAPPETI